MCTIQEFYQKEMTACGKKLSFLEYDKRAGWRQIYERKIVTIRTSR